MIHLQSVYKSFGDFHVLRGIDLHVERGETLVIIGRSGIGKSVSLRHIVGLLQPDRGVVQVLGTDLAQVDRKGLKDIRRRVGYLFQDGALLNWLTIGENVALPLRENYRLPKKEIRERAAEAIAHVELQDAVDKYPSEVSGGMRKRAGLARALVSNPDIILYDEPTSGLDPISSSIINHLINHLKKTLGVTQVVVTHDMGSAYSIADRIALLHEGTILAEGPPEEIRNSTDPAVSQFIHGKIDGPLSRSARPTEPASTSAENQESS